MTRTPRQVRHKRRVPSPRSLASLDVSAAFSRFATGLPAIHGRPPSHRGSHAQLLSHINAATAPAADFDAIIVPTNRPVAKYLREAASLARDLGCKLVPLCSGQATATEAASLGDELATPVVAIDMSANRVASLMPSFETSDLMAEPAFKAFARTSDLSLKRNLGLLLARAAGWQRVLFLDDDIASRRLADLRAAGGLLDSQDFDVVGLDNLGFADNSVVCHAYREAGGKQDTFIGGGAMVVAPHRIRSFFPDIYCEDWFFFYSALVPRRVAVTGSVLQKPYDPYASPDRAAAEEFGDCLAEGLFGLLERGAGTRWRDWQFWREFIDDRRSLIDWALLRVSERAAGEQRQRMLASLRAARETNAHVTPAGCLEFLDLWWKDLRRWQRHLATVPTCPDFNSGLVALGLADRAVWSAGGDEASSSRGSNISKELA